MNTKIKKFSIVAAVVLILFGCDKREIMLFDDTSTIYFDGIQTVYTFVENQDKVLQGYDYVDIKMSISGSLSDVDRPFMVDFVPDDTLHTMEVGMIEFVEGVVPANSINGNLKVKINYSALLDDSIYTARVKILPNEHFPEINLNFGHYTIKFGNMFTQPENWSNIDNYFGDYSNSWYKFMLDNTGLSSFPYKYFRGAKHPGISAEEAARWPMSAEECRAYAAQVRDSLEAYNNRNPLNPLTHLDGESKDLEVTMPNF